MGVTKYRTGVGALHQLRYVTPTDGNGSMTSPLNLVPIFEQNESKTASIGNELIEWERFAALHRLSTGVGNDCMMS